MLVAMIESNKEILIMEEGEFSFFIGQKATRKKFTSNEWNWALNSLSNLSPEYTQKNFLLLEYVPPKLELKEREILNDLKRLNICEKSR
jgi:hypothetical protein